MEAPIGHRPPPGAQLAPLGLPADDDVAVTVRRLVRERRIVQAAFLYRRSPLDAPAAELRPAVGLLTVGRQMTPAEADVVRAALGEVHGRPVEVVAVDEIGLPAVLAVAAPIGAGGKLEEAAVDVLRRRGRSRLADVRLAATFADATVHVPATDHGEARALRRGDRLTLPRLQLGGQAVVPAFSSPLMLLHTRPPHPGAVRVPGSVLAAAVPDGVEIALDPGCPTASVIATAAVRSLTGRHPARPPDVPPPF